MDSNNNNNNSNSNSSNNMNNAMMVQIMKELVQGRDLAKHLQSTISSSSSSSSSSEIIMIQRIIDSFERSVEILKSDLFYKHCYYYYYYYSQKSSSNTTTSDNPGIIIIESPHSGGVNGSPNSQDSISDPDFTAASSDSSKRKWMGPVEKRRVAGSAESGLQCPLDDGFSWRKYGQKDILNSPFPRAYYRCTYRQLQGCLATKQVQRNKDDPTLFDVVYRGKHSCNQAPSSPSSSSLPISTETTNIQPEPVEIRPNHNKQSHGVIWSFGSEPKDIRPIITNNNSSYQVPTSMQYYNDNITSFETNITPTDPQHPDNFQSDAAVIMTDPMFPFDQHDIMFDSPEFFLMGGINLN